jgi:predicted AAA+ superfamily ATPase
MKIERYYQNLDNFLKPNKVLVIFGPRQVGKTTLLQDYLQNTSFKYRLDSGENLHIQDVLSSRNFDRLRDYASGYDLIAIDEAQKVPHIGDALKILVDHFSEIRIIATGSSSFELAGQVGEPLTGRKITLTLFPISQIELSKIFNPFDLKVRLEEYLIYGSYPELITTNDKKEKIRILNEISGSYLIKEILEFERVKSSQKLMMVLRLLAYQIGNEVSFHEIAQKVGMDHKTLARYIDLLEKAFVIIRIRGFSKNLRNEIVRKNKFYFYDTGIRNAIIANFNRIEMRDDIGQLWENFLIVERIKKQGYHEIIANNYFWRTWNGEEIDFVEEREGKLFAYEFKWSAIKIKPPKSWQQNYPTSSFEVIHPENYQKFIL